MTVFLKLYSEVNLGDDLFLKIILERYPDVRFFLNAKKDYEDIVNKAHNLFVFQGEKQNCKKKMSERIRLRIIRILSPRFYRKNIVKNIIKNNKKGFDADVFVSIGGSIFMQPKKLPFYADIEYYNIINNKFDKIFYIGCNFGPYTDKKYKIDYTNIFSKATDVCFREKLSWEMFSNLKNARYRPDVVFGLDYSLQEKKQKTVGFSVVSPRNNIDEKSYIQKYVELVSFYQNKGYEVYLFSFCKKQKDEKTINEIIRLLKSENNTSRVFYDGNIETFLKVYSSVEKVYCGRFHAMILSMLFNQEIYPIIYSKKMTNVLEDISYRGSFVKIEDFHKINPQDLDLKISSNFYDIKEQKIRSKEQFKKLDLILKKA